MIEKIIQSFEGKDLKLTFEKKTKQRSINQNAYYWGVIVEIVRGCLHDLTGDVYTKEETHEFLKAKFLFKEVVNEATGEIINVPKSTTENSTTDCEVYHEEIRRFALSFFDTIIPLPNEQLEIEI